MRPQEKKSEKNYTPYAVNSAQPEGLLDNSISTRASIDSYYQVLPWKWWLANRLWYYGRKRKETRLELTGGRETKEEQRGEEKRKIK